MQETINECTLVYDITHDNKHYVERPVTLQNVNSARKELAASKLNELLGLHTVPRSFLAQLSPGHRSVVSEYAEGPEPTSVDDLSRWNGDRKSDVFAFEFLLANGDARFENIHVDSKNFPLVFDHGRAFGAGFAIYLPAFASKESGIGTHLPAQYSDSFRKSLKATSESQIRTELTHFLSPLELEALCFRRKVILLDLKTT